jgi:peptide/nickel transport system permease protein
VPTSPEQGRLAREDEPPIASTGDGSGPSRIWLALRSDPSFWIGGSIVLALVALAVLAPLIAPHDPALQYRVRDGGLTSAFDPVGPTRQFPLGTDRLGRDYLSRLLFGARTSLTVGLVANGLATLVGLVVGSLAGFAGNPPVRLGLGRYAIRVRLPIETALMRATDAVLAMPALLLAIALAAVVGPSLALVTIVIAGLLWTTTARIVYGRVLDVKRRDFIQAAEAIGVSPARILIRHVLPHVLPVVVVYGTLGIAAAVLFETSLSYLGVGVPPPTPSWGTMIAEHISYYATQPRLVILPGLAIMLTILAFNLLGDALRDALDPHLSGSRRAATLRSGRS